MGRYVTRHLPAVQADLYGAISDVCEATDCAGWLPGTEYWTWQMLSDPSPAKGVASDEEVQRLLALVCEAQVAAGGWIVWPDEDELPSAVGLDVWLPRYEKWRRER